MGAKQRLAAEDRDFLSLVTQAIFANPFSDERVAIDLKLTGMSPKTPEGERVGILTDVVAKRVDRIEHGVPLNIGQFVEEDRRLVENTVLFVFYHHYINRFDEHIRRQIEQGDTPLRLSFAPEALSFLRSRGFTAEVSRRYFALGYQIRRAFYFIYHHLVGRSKSMKELRRNLWNNVFTCDIGLYDQHLWNRMEDFSTLILGETGTGKGTAAMAIGRSGFIPFDEKNGAFAESFTQTFVSLNISQFPESLIESELFGHKKGAFTGAVDNYRGVFSRCSPHGAIFLDEIGEISIPVQIKLLQVIQDRIFSPVGSHQKERFHGRVIAATNRSINEIRDQGLFRDDFFYRLCSDVIIVPSLRQRIQEDRGELDDLLAHTIERIVGKPSDELAAMVKEVIDKQLGKDYPWPGNVRELEQCVRRVLLKCTYEGDYKSKAPDLAAQLAHDLAGGTIDAQGLLAGYCALLYKRHGTYEEVARRTNLDRRTVKKYVGEWED